MEGEQQDNAKQIKATEGMLQNIKFNKMNQPQYGANGDTIRIDNRHIEKLSSCATQDIKNQLLKSSRARRYQ